MNEEKQIFKVKGLNGEKALSGSISVSGAKNNALPLLAGSVLFEGPVSFTNVPNITDVEKIIELLEHAGAKVSRKGDEVTIDPSNVSSGDINVSIANKFRASIILTGPLLARVGHVSFPIPGGCVIGKRPIDLFLEGYEKLGAKVKETKNGELFEIDAEKLSGTEMFFRLQSVTGTETLLMAAALAEGMTVLKNVAIEPEVTDVAEFLKENGVEIEGIGSTTLTIHGTGGKLLKQGGKSHSVIPDRIEAGSYLVLGALCASDLEVLNCNPDHLELPLQILHDMGVPLEISENSVRIVGNTKPNSEFQPTSIRTHEYPGFPTDLQSLFTILLTQANGESVVEEMIFEGRLSYTKDLIHMGADIDVAHPHRAVVRGPSKLVGKELYSPDLRAGLAYLVAGILAKGESVIHNIHYIDRGYEDVENKLKSVGVAIQRLSE